MASNQAVWKCLTTREAKGSSIMEIWGNSYTRMRVIFAREKRQKKIQKLTKKFWIQQIKNIIKINSKCKRKPKSFSYFHFVFMSNSKFLAYLIAIPTEFQWSRIHIVAEGAIFNNQCKTSDRTGCFTNYVNSTNIMTHQNTTHLSSLK